MNILRQKSLPRYLAVFDFPPLTAKKANNKKQKISKAVIASLCLIGYGRVDVNIVLTCVDIYVYINFCYLSDQHQAVL